MKDEAFYRRTWWEMHTKGAQVLRKQLSHRDFCYWIRGVPDRLPCSVCANHARQYIGKHPPEKDSNSLRWSVMFHNTVNSRTKKPQYPYELALRTY